MDTSSLNKVVDSVLTFLTTYGNAILNKSFAVILKQVYATAISDLIWGFFCLILVIITIVILKKFCNSYVDDCKTKAKGHREDSEYSNWRKHVDSDDLVLPAFLGGIFILIPGFIMMILFNYAIMYLINPEWYAIKMVLELVSGK